MITAEFFDDSAAFLERARGYLAAHPLECGVLPLVAAKLAGADPVDWPRWFCAVVDGDQVIGVAMRTHPDVPHAAFLCPMPDAAVDAIADALKARGEDVPACNGDLDAAVRLVAAMGHEPVIRVHLRAWELHEVAWPERPTGDFRVADESDLPQIMAWGHQFHDDAERQAGREPLGNHQHDEAADRADVAAGLYYVWEVDGRLVSMIRLRRAVNGIAMVGPLFTEREARGHGYGAWAVAAMGAKALAEGNRPCLYTDQANPVSNKVYARVGYVPDHDEAEVVSG